jgi:4-diphosphocytidyl-2-C-methyl-D-erythritol kinase
MRQGGGQVRLLNGSMVIDSTIALPAFAKINWRLRVIGKRPDGYHEIDTVLQTISLHDTITLSPTNDHQITLVCDDRSLPSDATNLVGRAAIALQTRYGPNRGAYIRLEKRIPAEAGLGGGSSDAAVTLIGLSYLWETGASMKELLELAASLGADVPFFLHGGTAHGAGTGTEIIPSLDAETKFLLVLKPNAHVSSARAYESLNAPSLTTIAGDTILSSSLRERDRHKVPEELANDFEPVLLRREPEIERVKVALLKSGAEQALLAGSGSAVFGVFDNQEAQERAIQAIDLETGWRVFPCTTVGRDQYRRAMGPCGAMLAPVSDGMNAGA